MTLRVWMTEIRVQLCFGSIGDREIGVSVSRGVYTTAPNEEEAKAAALQRMVNFWVSQKKAKVLSEKEGCVKLQVVSTDDEGQSHEYTISIKTDGQSKVVI